MKASELVAQLQELIAEHGDVPVLVQGYESGADDMLLEVSEMHRRQDTVSCEGRYDWVERTYPISSRPRDRFTAVVLTRDDC